MARDADIEVRRRVSAAAPTNDVGDANRFSAEMHSGGSGGDCNIEPIVYIDSRHPVRCFRGRDGAAREIEKRSPRQILLANLHPIHPRLDGKANFREQFSNLINGPINNRVGGAKRQAVGNVANN